MWYIATCAGSLYTENLVVTGWGGLSPFAGPPRVHCVHRPDGRALELAAGVGRPSA